LVVCTHQAAAHVHRFLALDENVLRMSADASEGQRLKLIVTVVMLGILFLLFEAENVPL